MISSCTFILHFYWSFIYQIDSYLNAELLIQVTFASPNEDELVAMANAFSGENRFKPINRDKYSTESLFQMLKPAISVLLKEGIKVVVVTLGPDGVFLCSKGHPNSINIGVKRTKSYGFGGELYEIVTSNCPLSWYSGSTQPERRLSQFFAMHFPALPASTVRLTGAGDCLVGGTIASLCAGLDVVRSVAVGIAAAKAAVEAETNVPSEFSSTAISGMSVFEHA